MLESNQAHNLAETNSSTLRSSQSPKRSGAVSGSSIIPPRVQTSAAHARRYEGGVGDSGVIGSHVSRATIADGLDSRNTQALENQHVHSHSHTAKNHMSETGSGACIATIGRADRHDVHHPAAYAGFPPIRWFF